MKTMDELIEALRAEVIEWHGLFGMVKARADKAETRAEQLREKVEKLTGANEVIINSHRWMSRERNREKARAERLERALHELKDLMLKRVNWEPCNCGCPQQRKPDGPHSVTWLRAARQIEIAINKARDATPTPPQIKGATTTMSRKPFDGREIENATPELMRKELDKYFAHVQQHDPKSLEFALMVTGHGEADGGTHVRAMVGGPPQTIARIITELMDELIKRDPAFTAFFLLSFLQRARGHQDMSKFDFDSTGGADVEAQVKDLIDKLLGGTPPNGNVH